MGKPEKVFFFIYLHLEHIGKGIYLESMSAHSLRPLNIGLC